MKKLTKQIPQPIKVNNILEKNKEHKEEEKKKTNLNSPSLKPSV